MDRPEVPLFYAVEGNIYKRPLYRGGFIIQFGFKVCTAAPGVCAEAIAKELNRATSVADPIAVLKDQVHEVFGSSVKKKG
jgi:hypothetical protein